jgi:ABC-type sugar transport system permease subunit
MGKKPAFRISMSTREALEGLFFVSPFIVGIILFFAYPIIMSLWLSISNIDNIIGLKTSFAGIVNYTRAFFLDVTFVPTFLATVRDTLIKFPLTIILSLIISILINKDIVGRGFFRVAFFVPFLLGSGEVMQQLINQNVDKQVLSVLDGSIIPYNVLNYFGMTVVDAVQNVFGMIVTVLWGSGVQILLFLSGLQGISPALYESAKIDGATEWEMFWKITIPMISPMMLLNIIYTIVDSFLDIRNPLLLYIQSFGFSNGEFEYAAAMGWIYFAFIAVLILVVFGIMKGYMHTNEAERVRKDAGEVKAKKVFTIQYAKRKGA